MSSSIIKTVMGYIPNLGASILFAVLFGILFFVLFFQMYTQAKRFNVEYPHVKSIRLKISNVSMLLGILVYLVSCIIRCVSIGKSKNLGLDNLINLYIAENVLLYIAPTFYTTTVLLCFKYIIQWLDLKIMFNFRLFLYSDMVARVLQIVGSSYLASNYHTGTSVLVAGLFVQISLFTYFIFLQFKFHQHHHRIPDGTISTHIKMFSITFAAISILIILRDIIRVVGYLAHRGNYLNTQEWIFYVFTTLPLFLIPLIFAIINYKYNIFSFKTLVLRKTKSEQGYLQNLEDQADIDI